METPSRHHRSGHNIAHQISSLTYHAKPYCYVCNRCLFSLSLEIEMAAV